MQPEIFLFGESAVCVRFGDHVDRALHEPVVHLLAHCTEEPISGVIDVVPAYASLLVLYDAMAISSTVLIQEITNRLQQRSRSGVSKRTMYIPLYWSPQSAPDLQSMAERIHCTPREWLQRFTARRYSVYFLGFIAGFPYMGDLPVELAMPRLDQPRVRVAAGSIAIADLQVGIYPVESPGGWRIIGRTDVSLFDPAQADPALLHPGDNVRFVMQQGEIVENPLAMPAQPYTDVASIPCLKVVSAGPMTTVQDAGREGYGSMGVSPARAADLRALRYGNRALGNDPDAPALEMTAHGATFCVLAQRMLTITGAIGDVSLNGIKVSPRAPLQVMPGDIVSIGSFACGMRAYLCIAGGIAVSSVLGSASTDVRGEFGGYAGRPLQSGDIVTCGRNHGYAQLRYMEDRAYAVDTDEVDIRVVAGLPEYSAALISGHMWRVDARSDRMGVRLGCVDVGIKENGGQIVSMGMPRGAVQLPPDGNPIILLAEQQTTGGYAVPAVVIAADLSIVAQLRPGMAVRFIQISHEEAQMALQHEVAVTHNIHGYDATCLSQGFSEWSVEADDNTD